MGKSKSQFYKVQAIAGMRREPDTGELHFLVKWSGFTKDHDTWEPLTNLRSVEDMLRVYLRKQGLDPGKVLSAEDFSGHSDSGDADFVPYPANKKTTKKKQRKTPTVQSTLSAFFTLEKEEPQPVKSEKETEEKPCASLQQLSDFMSPVTRPLPSPVVPQVPKSLFAGLRPRPGRLDYDQPVKILGVKRGPAGLEYAILYKWSAAEAVGVGIATHEEVVQKAPWLFARFFLANSKLVL